MKLSTILILSTIGVVAFVVLMFFASLPTRVLVNVFYIMYGVFM